MKIKSKIVLGIAASGTALALIPMFAAFEAHVINVTAKIENALSVPTDPINFGTVFPQEELEKFLSVSLSQSFLDEPNADDVEYIIRQKPKCGVTSDNGTVLVGPTWTGHVKPDTSTLEDLTDYIIDCEEDRPDEVTAQPNDFDFYLLPDLCPYISKHPDETPEPPTGGNDGFLDSFHEAFTVAGDVVDWNDVLGHLAKSENDTTDRWTIDLAVPCFGGFCAQDWADFVTGINEGADPDDFTQPIENEHKIFGCNLWIEVTGVSRNGEEEPIVTTLTLAKTVLPALLHPDSDYTLTASSTNTLTLISGIEGAGAVTSAPVTPGIYALSETDGGHPGATVTWSCVGNATPEVDNGDGTATVTIAAGESVGCDVTNTYPQELTN